MKTFTRSILAALFAAVFFPLAAFAADCSAVSTRTTGTYTVTTFYLLDSDTAAATGTACDTNTWGTPEMIRVSVLNDTGCASGYSAKINGRAGSATMAHQVGYIASNKSVDVISKPTPRYLQAVSSGLSGCIDFDLIAEAYYPNSASTPAISGVLESVILCGQADENGTIYLGPATAAFGGDGSDASVGSTACDALDNATEATADAPILTDLAFGIQGAWCHTDGTLGAGETVTFTLRSAAADTSPVQSCTISVGESDCSITVPTDTDVAAGATIAVKAVQSSDNADDNLWCREILAVR